METSIEKRATAPRWVMTGILVIMLIDSVIGILSYFDILPTNQIFYQDEYGQSVGMRFHALGMIWSCIILCFYATVTTVSIIRKWITTATAGAILIVIELMINLILTSLETNASSYYELKSYFEIGMICSHITSLLYIIGIIMLILSTTVSNSVKISVSAYVLAVVLLSYIYQYAGIQFDLSLYLTIGKPFIVMGLLAYYLFGNKNI